MTAATAPTRSIPRLVGRAVARGFSGKGRASRRELYAYYGFVLVAMALLDVALGFQPDARVTALTRLLVETVLLVPLPALLVRRLHDRGLDGRWSLVIVAGLGRILLGEALRVLGAGSAWATLDGWLHYPFMLVDLAFAFVFAILVLMPGTPGDNRYGPPAADNATVPDPPPPAQPWPDMHDDDDDDGPLGSGDPLIGEDRAR